MLNGAWSNYQVESLSEEIEFCKEVFQTGQKVTAARRAKLNERRRTLDVRRSEVNERNEADGAFSTF
jgi:hypothetical protein